MEYTIDQQNVIDSRGESLLVTAAAGSGKTSVLVARIMDRVLDKNHPVDIDHILCLTFTDAAAAEMRARLLGFINEALSEEPDNQRLLHQSVLVHRSFVMTIDSFCYYVVSNHFQEIGLDPGMKIIDAGQEKVLRQQIIDDYFEELYLLDEDDKRRKDFITAVEIMSDKGDDRNLKDLVFSVYEAALEFPHPDEWLLHAPKQYKMAAAGEADWISEYADYIEDILTESKKILCNCLDDCSQMGYEKGEKLLQNDIEKLERALDKSQKADTSFVRLEVFDDYFKSGLAGSFETWRPFKENPSQSDSIKNRRNKIKENLRKIKDDYFKIPIKRSLENIESLYPFVETVITLVSEYGRRLLEEKKANLMMSFADCEHYALDILLKKTDGGYVRTETAIELSEYFEEVMCDEYQDSNEIQEAILDCISREHKDEYNRFIVGDVKQSIYRFRKANPGLIMSKMSEYGDTVKRRIDLKSNFRSRREIIDTVNLTFERLMRKGFGGIDYDERARLSYNAINYDPEALENPTELHIVSREKNDDTDRDEIEARLIASIVKKNVGITTVFDKSPEKGTYVPRKAGYGDIAILLRTIRLASKLTEVFRKEGIPIYVTSSKGYFDAPEIVTMLSFLRVIDNPRQDIYLYRVLTSPIGGLSDSDVALIKSATVNDAICLIERLEQYEKDSGPEGLSEKVSCFMDRLSYYRSLVTYESVGSLIERILDDTGFLYYALAMPDGKQRERNLRLLTEKAAEFEKGGRGGLFKFISYIDEMVGKHGEDMGPAAPGEDITEAVRVFTIHKSKGLEFPICIIGDLAHGFNLMDTKDSLMINSRHGIACRYYDPVRRIKKDTILRKYFSAKETDDTKAEELRLLYVAMTRAKEKLIFTAVTDQNKTDTEAGVLTADRKFAEAGRKIEPDARSGQCPVIYLRSTNCLLDYVLLGLSGNEEVLHSYTLDDIVGDELSEKTDIYERRRLLPELIVSNTESERISEEFSRRFSTEYSHPELCGLYTKTSVSELKKDAYEKAIEDTAEDAYTAVPAYSEGRGTDFGTAHHRVMELFDFSGDGSENDIKEQIHRMAEDGFMPEDYTGYINPKRIKTFLDSPCGRRMREAALSGKLRREQPFFLGIPASEMKDELPPSETVLVQGIIDALWEEDGQMVILDYKTDRIDGTEELIKRYETQLYYYKRALEAATGKTVKECILYSFCLGDEISIENPAATNSDIDK